MPYFADLKIAVQQVLDTSTDNLSQQDYQRAINVFVREVDEDLVREFSNLLHKIFYEEIRVFKITHKHNNIKLKKLETELAHLQSLSGSAEYLVKLVHLELELDAQLTELKASFRRIAVVQLFDKLQYHFTKDYSDSQVHTAFNKLSAEDFAVIISTITNNICNNGWVLSWRSQDSYFQQSVQKAQELFWRQDLESLDILMKRIYDQALMSIPETPRFCTNSTDEWRVLDAGMLEQELKSNGNYHAIISKIDNSGQTGIGYILDNLPTGRSLEVQILDKLLSLWHSDFLIEPGVHVSGYEQMLMLNDHEKLLVSMDKFFENCIQNKLPKKLNTQLEEGEIQSAQVNVHDLITKVAAYAEDRLLNKLERGVSWANLFYSGEDTLEMHLFGDDFKNLIKQYIEDMQRRNWKNRDESADGLLVSHLQARRNAQSELRSNAEGSLRTNPIDGGDPHTLSSTEVRDAIDRNAYIDTAYGESAQDFCDILIAANMLVYGGLTPESILSAMSSRDVMRREFAEKNRAARAQKQSYRPSTEELKAEQLAFIDEFVDGKIKFGQADYIAKALVKLHSFLNGESMQLSGRQISILENSKISYLVAKRVKRHGEKSNRYVDGLSKLGVNKVRKLIDGDDNASSEDDLQKHQCKKVKVDLPGMGLL